MIVGEIPEWANTRRGIGFNLYGGGHVYDDSHGNGHGDNYGRVNNLGEGSCGYNGATEGNGGGTGYAYADGHVDGHGKGYAYSYRYFDDGYNEE